MKCANCGTENGKMDTVCRRCGEPLDGNAAEKNGKKNRRSIFDVISKKTLAIIAGVAAVVLVALVLIVVISSNVSSDGKFALLDREMIFQAFDDETVYFLSGGKKMDSRLDAEELESWNSSMDGNVAFFTVQEGKDVVLYAVSGEDVLYITENADQVMMSETGAALVYVQEEELYRHDLKNGAELIASEVEQIQTISPDGKTIAYVGLDDITYVYNDGKSSELGEETVVVSISDGGKYIYCIEPNDDDELSLYLYNLKGRVGLVANEVNTENAVFYTNKDHSQMIFRAKNKTNDKWYAVEKKELNEDKHDLGGTDTLIPVIPQSAQVYARDELVILGVESLADMAYRSANLDDESEKLIYVGSDWKTNILVSKVTNIQISADGEKLFYMKSSRVFSTDVEVRAQVTQLADDVSEYAITADGKTLYFIDKDAMLYCKKGSKDPELLSEDVEALYVTHDGYGLFVSEDCLYAADGTKVTLLTDEFEEGIVLVTADCTYYVVAEDDSRVIYAAASGTKFKDMGILLEESLT